MEYGHNLDFGSGKIYLSDEKILRKFEETYEPEKPAQYLKLAGCVASYKVE